MKRTIGIAIALLALLQPAFAQQQHNLKVELRFKPQLNYQQPSFRIFDWQLQDRHSPTRQRPFGLYDRGTYRFAQESTFAGFGSRFNTEKLSFKELFRDSSFSVRSPDYIPGVRGTKIDKKGGEFWIKF